MENVNVTISRTIEFKCKQMKCMYFDKSFKCAGKAATECFIVKKVQCIKDTGPNLRVT